MDKQTDERKRFFVLLKCSSDSDGTVLCKDRLRWWRWRRPHWSWSLWRWWQW